jgi:hypothetical protein
LFRPAAVSQDCQPVSTCTDDDGGKSILTRSRGGGCESRERHRGLHPEVAATAAVKRSCLWYQYGVDRSNPPAAAIVH